MLKIVAVTNPVSNARFVYGSALRGAGDSKYVTVVTSVGTIIIRPLVSILLVNVFTLGLYGVWYALVADSAICFTLSWLRFRKGEWAHIKL